MSCEGCHDRHYLHIGYDGGGPEIEACDMCRPGTFNDVYAAALHRVFCGCDVPENSWDRPDTKGCTMLPFATFDVFPHAIRLLKDAGRPINRTKDKKEVDSLLKYIEELRG